MAYLQTTATSIPDMLNTIATFANGLGWTVERNGTFTSGSNTQHILSLSRAGFDYAHIVTAYNTTALASKTDLYVSRSLGINLSGNSDSQPNRGFYSLTNLLTAGPYVNMWLFGESGSNPYVHIVIEHTAGRFRHFGFGELVKKGTWTGGGYNYGTSWSQTFVPNDTQNPTSSVHNKPFSGGNTSTSPGGIRVDECDATANNVSGIDNRYLAYSRSRSRRADSGLCIESHPDNFQYTDTGMGLASNVSFSVYNQRQHLIRLAHFCTSASGYRRYIGEPPAVRGVRVETFSPGDELVIGSDTWKIFPLVNKTLTTNIEYSNFWGLAYKKVT